MRRWDSHRGQVCRWSNLAKHVAMRTGSGSLAVPVTINPPPGKLRAAGSDSPHPKLGAATVECQVIVSLEGSRSSSSTSASTKVDRWSSSLGGNARLGLPHMRMAIGKPPVRGACLHSQVAPVSIGSPGPNGPLGWYHSSDASPPPPAAKRRALIRAGLILIRVGTGPAPGLPTATPHLIELMN